MLKVYINNFRNPNLTGFVQEIKLILDNLEQLFYYYSIKQFVEGYMIKSTVGHIQYNIDLKNMRFYKDLFGFLGWKTLCDEDTLLGIEDDHKASLWFTGPAKKVDNDYDGPGANHLGIAVPNQADVDETVAYLKEHNVLPLFETPRHRAEFCGSEDDTYYQVMFESPDHLLFEVVYMGPKSK
jgi:catechol 2,3-dioxygenase-like lactoylglutathione lyase family enzyme